MKATILSMLTTVCGRRRATGPGRRNPRARGGQAVVFLVMALVILCFVVLWCFDVHKIIYVKALSQNSGDAAALMAARWQGIALDLIGDLNIMQALALARDDGATSSAVTNIQARLCYVGPAIALLAAQQAAKNNGIYAQSEYADWITRCAVKAEAFGQQEYGRMLRFVAEDGVAVWPLDSLFARASGHILYDPGFYEAIAAKYWCWFYYNAPTLLEDYTNYHWWPDLPPLPDPEPFFDLGIVRRETDLRSLVESNTFLRVAEARETPVALRDEDWTAPAVWYCYNSGRWGPWNAISPDEGYPLTGTIKPQHDYMGANAPVLLQATPTRVTPGAGGIPETRTVVASAAAKPFGCLSDEQRPNAWDLVLPVFHDVRLIPLDGSSASPAIDDDLAWIIHISQHLPEPGYMLVGPRPSACRYCRQLVTWERPEFRKEGADWLKANWRLCILPSGGGGGGRGGGTKRRGH